MTLFQHRDRNRLGNHHRTNTNIGNSLIDDSMLLNAYDLNKDELIHSASTSHIKNQ